MKLPPMCARIDPPGGTGQDPSLHRKIAFTRIAQRNEIAVGLGRTEHDGGRLITSGRPVTAGEGLISAARMLRAMAVVLLLLAPATAVPAAAIAVEPTSSYGTEPPKREAPSSEPPKPESAKPPTTEVHASKEGTSPTKEVQKPELPEQRVSASHRKPAPAKADSLPFTGFDLRWELSLGTLLILAGSGLIAAQRRHARERHR